MMPALAASGAAFHAEDGEGVALVVEGVAAEGAEAHAAVEGGGTGVLLVHVDVGDAVGVESQRDHAAAEALAEQCGGEEEHLDFAPLDAHEADGLAAPAGHDEGGDGGEALTDAGREAADVVGGEEVVAGAHGGVPDADEGGDERRRAFVSFYFGDFNRFHCLCGGRVILLRRGGQCRRRRGG